MHEARCKGERKEKEKLKRKKETKKWLHSEDQRVGARQHRAVVGHCTSDTICSSTTGADDVQV